ncbi:hypothetical protein NLG97_g6359 [Lecanicillium saksenae]|uniref:Uncharacterized protein n=1 Tax=Lecanicillium saksenae TaxID=468837 RepID=A0ACC1QQZ9_9HYPO|nr:hypothetical protein NLG97_g6359 [Lecanicillium saksenae]
MKFPIPFLALAALAQADTQVIWESCKGDRTISQSGAGVCTNVAGRPTSGLCKIIIPRHGADRCEFYTASCGQPGGKTYHCSAATSPCDTRSWEPITVYRCGPN